jgi:hypothetical protein
VQERDDAKDKSSLSQKNFSRRKDDKFCDRWDAKENRIIPP